MMFRIGREPNNMINKPAYICNGKPVTAQTFYKIACDPTRSVAVEACAGAGKTWMLVSRMLRALLAGATPQSILAITYTKKAAGEMRERLQQWLYDFSHEADDGRLTQELVARGLELHEAQGLLSKARGLHAVLLHQPRGVEIRTFHGWFAQLLGAAPMGVLDGLGLPASYELIEDDADLFEPAWYEMLCMCVKDEGLKGDLQALIRDHGQHNTREALKAAWSKRIEFMLADEQGVVNISLTDAPDSVLEGVLHPDFRSRWLRYAAALGQEKTKTPQDAATKIENALSQDDSALCLSQIQQALFVKTENRLKTNLQKFEAAKQAALELEQLLSSMQQHEAFVYHQRMARLTRAFLQGYRKIKQEQGIIDMADLERAALRLLGDTQTYGWVAERLDVRITQVLIDEFQDTNPLQWQALHSWLSAYGGVGGGGRLSVFIVGDPKQSIYRFRRADPAVFNEACNFIQQTFSGSLLACDHTRRNAPQVIDCVNTVFCHAQKNLEFSGFRQHTTDIEIDGVAAYLPYIVYDDTDKQKQQTQLAGALWRDSLTQPRFSEEKKRREIEMRQAADLIEYWLSRDGWKPSDIKVLSRKKDRLRELLLELNRRQIPWRFADNIELAQTQEAQDVIALLDVLSSKRHDLSLAQVLRSPIFGLDDACLIELARQVIAMKAALPKPSKEGVKNEVSWWDALISLQKDKQDAVTTDVGEASSCILQLKQAGKMLQQWAQYASVLPPHDLLDMIYNQAEIEVRYAQAVPTAMREEVLGNLRALLQQSLLLDSGRYVTPYNFVRALKKRGLKSEHPQGGDAVELLTVHGAKGLEAKGVLVLDTDPSLARLRGYSLLLDWPADQEAPQKMIFYVSQKNLPEQAQLLAQKETQADLREELNALYVAMTRARERLVFSALEPRGGSSSGSWWQRFTTAHNVLPIDTQLFSAINRSEQCTHPQKEIEFLELPLYEFNAHSHVSTSQGSTDQISELIYAPADLYGVARAAIPAIGEDEQIQRFGSAVHRFLEWGFTDTEHINALATELALTQEQAQEAAKTAERIMHHEQSSRFFDETKLESSANEVELWYQGRALRIDRLVKLDNQWWVLDYKSAWNPLKHRAQEYKEQLHLYRQALMEIYPNTPIRTAIITGSGEVLET